MTTLFDRGREGLLVVTALLEGCGYYGCTDDLKRGYVPNPANSHWLDSQTLELDFGAALRAPTDVDPSRFALLRYNAKITEANVYYCAVDVCYRTLSQVEAIPESLDWDPADRRSCACTSPIRSRPNLASPGRGTARTSKPSS